jgi:hypothetical protein
MAKKRLGEKDIDQLLLHYRSERRRLMFQLDQVRVALKDLKRAETNLPKATAKPSGKATRKASATVGAKKRGPGRPRKSEAAPKKAKRGPGRPPKRVRPERELNAWDGMVLASIKSSGKLMPKEEILEHAVKWAATHEPSMKKPELEQYVTRTLQKLSSKKGLLGTHHTGLRRGYHYGLKDWFFNSSGKLRRQHYDKLVLTKDE